MTLETFEIRYLILFVLSILTVVLYLVFLYRKGEIEKIKSRLKTILLVIIVLILGMFVLDFFFLM